MDHPIIIIAQTQIVLIDSNHVCNNLQTLFEALRKVRASLPSTPQLTPNIYRALHLGDRAGLWGPMGHTQLPTYICMYITKVLHLGVQDAAGQPTA